MACFGANILKSLSFRETCGRSNYRFGDGLTKLIDGRQH
jgi:hypothetical protein